MSDRHLLSGKAFAPEQSNKQQKHTKQKATNLSTSTMSAATLLIELKSMRTDLTGQIAKLNDDFSKRFSAKYKRKTAEN